MVDDSVMFGASLVGLFVGLAVMLYGVTLTAGQSMNTPMIVGGLIVLGAVGAMTAPGLQSDHEHAHE
jgi:hypothetical protein